MNATAARICTSIEEQRGPIARLLDALVAFPTVNPPGDAYEPCVEFLRGTLLANGFDVESIEIPVPTGVPPRVVLIGSYGDGPGTLYFHGHYDVVPASCEGQFSPRWHGDTLFGRGTSDMKGGLAAMVYAARALRPHLVPGRGRVALVFVPDEETGGRFGSASLAAMGRLGTHGLAMLLPEPTSGVIWHESRGALTYAVRVAGRAAHVGLADEGVNAFELAHGIAGDLFDLKSRLGSGTVLLVGGRVEAGSNFNVVPDACSFTVDCRPGPDEDVTSIETRVLEIFERARARGVDVTVTEIQRGSASYTSTTSELARALSDSAAEVTGAAPVFEACPGLLETRFYSERGVPALAFGPGILAVSHGPKEFVRMDRVLACAQVFALTALRMLR